MPMKILIVGAGLTGSLCANGLKKCLPSASVHVWDKARGAGGRMATSRTETGNLVDLGAQYITTSVETLEEFKDEYSPLLANEIIEPLSGHVDGMKAFGPEIRHFVVPKGISSVVKYFLGESMASVHFNQHVSTIVRIGDTYQVTTKDGLSDSFDIVISTMPVPQLLALPNIESILATNAQPLSEVEYSTRFIMVWYYNDAVKPNTDWIAKYMDDEVFRYVAWDNLKRNQTEENSTVVFHTSVEFGKVNKTRSKEDVADELFRRAGSLFPDWPAPNSTRCHKWLYSQVVSPFEGNKEKGCIVLTEKPLFMLAGDAFTCSNVNGCISSARKTVQLLCSSVN